MISQNSFYSLYKKISQKYSSNILGSNEVLLLCILFEMLHTIEFLSSSQITKLSRKDKQILLEPIANMYVRDYKFNTDILSAIIKNKNPYLITITDITSDIISFCNQAGSDKILPYSSGPALKKMNKIIESM